MIIITYVGGGERLINGTTLKKLDQESARLGQIGFMTSKDGYPFGECHGVAFKGSIADIVEVDDAVFQAKVDERKAAQEKEKKEREDAEAKRKSEADARAAQRLIDAEAAQARAREARKLVNRMKRLPGLRQLLAWGA